MSSSNPSPQDGRGEKAARVRGDRKFQGNGDFQTQHDGGTYELTEPVAAWARSAQVQDRWGPNTKRGKWI